MAWMATQGWCRRRWRAGVHAVARAELVGLLRLEHERLADEALLHGEPRGVELGVVPVGEHRAELRPARRVGGTEAREVVEAGGHRLLDERADAALEALARDRGLQVEERGDHGEVGPLAVEHEPPVVVQGMSEASSWSTKNDRASSSGEPGAIPTKLTPRARSRTPRARSMCPLVPMMTAFMAVLPPTITGSADACPRPGKRVRLAHGVATRSPAARSVHLLIAPRTAFPLAAVLLAAALVPASASPRSPSSRAH